MKGADPAMNKKNMRRKHEEKHERVTPTNKNDHTYARSSKHKEIHDLNPTKDDTQVTVFSP